MAGHTVQVEAEVRSATRSSANLIVELAKEPHTKFIQGSAVLTPQWQKFRFAGVVPTSLASGEAQFTMFLGYGTSPGEVQVRNVRVQNLGVFPVERIRQTISYYGAGKRDTAWLAEAEKRIEKIRRTDLLIQISQGGKPVPNAEVAVDMLRHDFRFGTAAPASLITGTDENSRKFREVLQANFDTVTLENDLKWTVTESSGYSAADLAIEWLARENFRIRGHNAVWGSERNMPAGPWSMQNDVLKARVLDRVEEDVSRYKGRLYLWDVVNEASTETGLWERIGWDMFPETFRAAKAADPKALLCYNDYNITEESQVGVGPRSLVKDRISRLVAADAPIDVIGIQAHVGTPITPTSKVLSILDEMASFKKRLEITEYDLGVQDDKVHGQHLADFLTACFSHPSMDGFMMWGFWENAHWRANEGGHVYRKDWSPRPAAKAWKELVRGKWWTKERLKTNRNGIAAGRPFYGLHRITVRVNGQVREFVGEIKRGEQNRIIVNL